MHDFVLLDLVSNRSVANKVIVAVYAVPRMLTYDTSQRNPKENNCGIQLFPNTLLEDTISFKLCYVTAECFENLLELADTALLVS